MKRARRLSTTGWSVLMKNKKFYGDSEQACENLAHDWAAANRMTIVDMSSPKERPLLALLEKRSYYVTVWYKEAEE